MQPGLNRAIPMAILGFLLAALGVIILRGLQQLDPLWAPGPGLVLSAFTSAGFFVWGMGAFDPKMSVHGEHADDHHEEEAPKPVALLSSSVWTLFTLMLIALIVLMLFAVFGGFTLRTTDDALASTTAVGYFPVELFGRDLLISELVVFSVFIIVMFASLAVTAGAMGWMFVYLARTIAEVKVAPNAPINAPALPSGQRAVLVSDETAPQPITLRMIVNFLVVFVIMAVISYAVLIGLTLPTILPPNPSPTLMTVVSLAFAALIAYLFVISRQTTLAVFLILFLVLYIVFYYALIGLALPAFVPSTGILLGMPMLLVVDALLSLVNALLVAFLLVRPTLLLQTVGRIAAWLVRLLRRVPVLFQR